MTKLKVFITGLVAFAGALSAYGQEKQGPWLLGLGAHGVNYNVKEATQSGQDAKNNLGLKNWGLVPALSKIDVAYRFLDFLAADARFVMGEVANRHIVTANGQVDNSKKLYLAAGLGVRAFYVLDFWEPYLRLGAAYHRYDYCGTQAKVGTDTKKVKGENHSILVNGGLGMNFWLGETQKFGLNIEGGYNWNPLVKAEGGKAIGGIADHFQIAAGVVFNFGAESNDLQVAALEQEIQKEKEVLASHKDQILNLNNKVEEVKKEVEELKSTQVIPVVPIETPMEVEVVDELSFSFEKIKFDFGQTQIKKEHKSILKEAAKKINSATGVFYVNGFADKTNQNGIPKLNEVVSKKRAEAVKDFLVKEGVDASRLVAVGCGECKDFSPNRNNRFVQISISKCDKQ